MTSVLPAPAEAGESEIGARVAELPAKTPKEVAAKIRIMRWLLDFPVDQRVLEPMYGGDCEHTRIGALGLWTAIEDAERMAGSS